MEVSSHSLDQRRVDGLEFDVAFYQPHTRSSRLSRNDGEIFEAKARLLDYMKAEGTVVINASSGMESLKPRSRPLTFAARQSADIRAENIRYTSEGSKCGLSPPWICRCCAALIGDINVENALAAAAAAFALDKRRQRSTTVCILFPKSREARDHIYEAHVLRDYAHTPDALRRSLKTAVPSPAQADRRFRWRRDRDKGNGR